MNKSLTTIEKPEKGMDIDECIARADKFIRLNGACLLVMDVIGSGNYKNPKKLFEDYTVLLEDLSKEFDEYLPENSLTHVSRVEKGFNLIIGDGATGAINEAMMIPRIVDYVNSHPTAIPIRYAVAEDGYDSAGTSLIK